MSRTICTFPQVARYPEHPIEHKVPWVVELGSGGTDDIGRRVSIDRRPATGARFNNEKALKIRAFRCCISAETEGFEPSVPVRVLHLSRVHVCTSGPTLGGLRPQETTKTHHHLLDGHTGGHWSTGHSGRENQLPSVVRGRSQAGDSGSPSAAANRAISSASAAPTART